MEQSAISFFENFCKDYEIKKELDMKSTYSYRYFHTYRVLKWMNVIINKLELTPKEKEFAKVVAIFHDLGRFSQLTKYQNYNDIKTKFDHGKESVSLLKENQWFSKNKITLEEEKALSYAIYNHNKLEMEPTKDIFASLLAKLIRDADKLAVIEESYQFDSFGKEKTYGNLSPNIKKQFMKHHLLNAKDVITFPDEICYYIAYIFDLNFKESFQLIKENHLLEPYLKILEQTCEKQIKRKIDEEIHLFLNYQNAY